MAEAGLNLLVILGSFAIDLIYRQVLVRESGYLALDLALFSVLDTGFTLFRDWRTHTHLGAVDPSKVAVAFVFYLCLVVVYTNLQRRQYQKIERAFNAFEEFLADRHEAEIGEQPDNAKALREHHKDQRGEVRAVRLIAEETIWINVFLERPRPAKLQRAKDLVALLGLVVAEEHVPRDKRIKPEYLYLKRSWLHALGAATATLLTVAAAVWPT